ncbi:hypothetical protein RAS2_15270 [Phycisphaerae bacterium RAS2]|nr:hypothetical protein RAS2_15270 [Phycisphaerae bacterium RAS2]
MYLGRNYSLYRSQDDGATWTFVTRMPSTGVRRWAGWSRMASRLLRHEVRAMNVTPDGTVVASNRECVYFASPGEPDMRRAQVNTGSQPLAPPMTMTVGPDGRVMWGEYDSTTRHGKPVRLFVSSDGGRSYEVARVFEGGSILHLHNIVWDASRGHYWVLAGDHDDEPGIGVLSADLKSFDWLVKGKQLYRAVEVFDGGDRLIYVMDSEKERNYLVHLNKSSGKAETTAEFEGSCIYACRFGEWLAFTTTVEPSKVNPARHASLYVSRDGATWSHVLRAEKDAYHPVYFQYGSIILPRGESDRDTLFFSGQAVREWDGRAATATLEAGGA